MARLPCKGIWPPSRFSIGYGPWKPQFKFENQIFLLDLPKIISFCPKIVPFYILNVFRAHLKSPFCIQQVLFCLFLAYFCFNFGLFSPRYASIFSMRCILTHKSFLPKIVIFLIPWGVHCEVGRRWSFMEFAARSRSLFLVKIRCCNRGGKTTKMSFLPYYYATSPNGTPRNLQTTQVIFL